MRRTTALIVATATLLSGCTFGSNAARLGFANAPDGAPITVTGFTAQYRGELLEVRPDGLVVKEKPGRIIVIPFTRIRGFDIAGLGSEYGLVSGAMPNDALISRVAGVSHFPQGITPAIQAKLLEQSRQAAFVVVQ